MKNLRDMTIREAYEGVGEEEGRVITWKIIAGMSATGLILFTGLVGAGRFMFLVPAESMNLQLGWICIGVATLGGLLLTVGLPLYMRGGSKNSIKHRGQVR